MTAPSTVSGSSAALEKGKYITSPDATEVCLTVPFRLLQCFYQPYEKKTWQDKASQGAAGCQRLPPEAARSIRTVRWYCRMSFAHTP